MLRLTKNYFEKLYIPSLCVESYSKKFVINEKQYTINFIVIPGDKDYHQDYTQLFTKANFIFLFDDVSKKGSFDEAKGFLYNDISSYARIFKNKITNFYFVGNKVDMALREEPKEKIENFCKRHNFEMIEISVKVGRGVKGLINNIIDKYNEIVD